MNLDIGTVLFSGLLISLALVLFSWSLALSPRAPRWRADGAWGITALFLGVGLLLTQGRWSPWVSVILANGLVIAGYHLLENSLRRFAARPFPDWLPWTLAALFLVPFLVFTFVWDFYPARVAVYTLLVSAVWVRILFLLPRLPEFTRHPVLVRAFWGLCTLFLLAQAARAFFALADGGNTLLGANGALALMLLVNLLVVTGWSLGFATLDVVRGQRQLEAALESRDKMLQLIAHDLRGPLGGQVGLLALMQESGTCREEEGGEMLALLSASAQNSYDLLENLLDWGLNQKGAVVLKPESLGARDLLVQASEPYTASARAKNVALEIEADPDEQVWADRKTVTTIVRNLVSNAIKFTPTGGVVRLSFARNGGRPQFGVADSGPGFTPLQQQSLNSGNSLPSTPGTDREHGSGLGLALCRDFARLNAADLQFVNSDRGAKATLTLQEQR